MIDEVIETDSLSFLREIDGNILLLASPCSGKSYELFNSFEDANFILDFETKTNLKRKIGEKISANPESDLVIVDDLFRVIAEKGSVFISDDLREKRIIAVTTP